MCRVLQCMEHSSPFSAREIKFTRATFGDVSAYDAIDLIPMGLHGDCGDVSITTCGKGFADDIHGFHFIPASSNAFSAVDRCAALLANVFSSPREDPYSDRPSRFSSKDGVFAGVMNGSAPSTTGLGLPSAKSVVLNTSLIWSFVCLDTLTVDVLVAVSAASALARVHS